MSDAIMQCIQIRKDFFEKYYSVPDDVQSAVDSFFEQMNALAEQANDAQDFEAKFAKNGFQEILNSLLMRCTPKPYKMTGEEKAVAKETAKEIFKEDRSRIVKEVAVEALDNATVMIEEEAIAQMRKGMIEADVFDDYTRATNAVDMFKDVGGLFKSLFKKKK